MRRMTFGDGLFSRLEFSNVQLTVYLEALDEAVHEYCLRRPKMVCEAHGVE